MVPAYCVDVLVDDSGRLGPLSYLVPPGVTLAPGDAVTVPFGKSERHGLVLGVSGDPSHATREVVRRLGERVSAADMSLISAVAELNFASLAQVSTRLSPSSGRNSAPIDTGDVRLSASTDRWTLPVPPKNWKVRTYLRPPLISPSRVAALEALRLAGSGQVLILCPTVRLVDAVLSEFESGAARLDSRCRAGAWNGWRSGSVRVAVGTRAAAFYSAQQLAGIVVVEEQHPGHQESSLPYTHARDVARLRATAHDCALTFISATPSASAMAGSKVLTFDGAQAFWPKVEIVDRTVIHPSMRQVPPAARRHLGGRLPVVVVAETSPSRRLCVRCSEVRPCSCGSVCTHPVADPCIRCGAMAVRWVGWSAERIRATLPEAQALTLGELAGLEQADRVVVFLNADPIVTAPGFDALSRAGATLLSAAEAAGPRGRLVVVTSTPEHAVFASLRKLDWLPIAKQVWDLAKSEGLPPFGRLVTVRMNWSKPPRVSAWPGRVRGPRRRDGEWEVLVQVDDTQFATLRPLLEKIRSRGKVRISVQ